MHLFEVPPCNSPVERRPMFFDCRFEVKCGIPERPHAGISGIVEIDACFSLCSPRCREKAELMKHFNISKIVAHAKNERSHFLCCYRMNKRIIPGIVCPKLLHRTTAKCFLPSAQNRPAI